MRAAGDGPEFERYVHDPRSVDPKAEMPAHKDYDQATLDALTAYFKTFAPAGKR